MDQGYEFVQYRTAAHREEVPKLRAGHRRAAQHDSSTPEKAARPDLRCQAIKKAPAPRRSQGRLA